MTENPEPVTVVVADDQSAVREGLVLLLGTVPGIAVTGEAEDGEAAVEIVAAKNPQVVLMDLNMPRCDGVEATRRIRASHPQTQVVVLTTYSDDESIIGALQAGALGYLTKDATRAEIGRAVLAAAAGQAVLDPEVQQRLLSAAVRAPAAPAAAGADPADTDLTPRESEVLRLIAAGKSNREIARALFVSEATVKTHVNRIFAKTGSRDRTQAMRYAYTHGYADPQLPVTAGLRGAPRPAPCRSAARASSAGAGSRRWSTRRAVSPCSPGHDGSRKMVMPSPAASASGPARIALTGCSCAGASKACLAVLSAGRPRSGDRPGRGCTRGSRGRGPWARSGTRRPSPTTPPPRFRGNAWHPKMSDHDTNIKIMFDTLTPGAGPGTTSLVPDDGQADGQFRTPYPGPLGAVPLERLEAQICELAGHLTAATCRFLILLADFDARRGWASWEMNSCAQWLSWKCQMSSGAAREHVRVARALRDLPVIRDEFAAGRLFYAKVRALTRIATPDTDRGLAAHRHRSGHPCRDTRARPGAGTQRTPLTG